MRLPWDCSIRQSHNSCCALAYQLLCACTTRVVRLLSSCCAVNFVTPILHHKSLIFSRIKEMVRDVCICYIFYPSIQMLKAFDSLNSGSCAMMQRRKNLNTPL